MTVYVVVYASNVYGTSQPSTIGSGANITIMVAPSMPGTPSTTYVNGNVIVTWTAPTIGAPILNYTIMIACAGGTWATTTYCNGANATTIANMYCTIP